MKSVQALRGGDFPIGRERYEVDAKSYNKALIYGGRFVHDFALKDA
jgi:hypothetical protein